jgi:hypothetical protein
VVVNFHTAFNLALAVLFLPLTNWRAALLVRILPDLPRLADQGKPIDAEGDDRNGQGGFTMVVQSRYVVEPRR